MNPISTIDFAQPGHTLQKEIDRAFADIGFLVARNIGIDHVLLNDVFRSSHAFFNQAADAKNQFEYRTAAENFGYQGMQQENLDPTAPADLKETFTMRNIINRPLTPDRWPSADFQALVSRLYANVFEAANTLQRHLATILEVPENFFTDVHSGENVTLRLLYYPAIPSNKVADRQLGAGAHTDYGMLTFLFQDSVGGLQVQGLDGQWIDVETDNDSVVINCGDLLERWTNGRYQSTLHRVQPKTEQQNRLSIAMFLDPDSKTQVQALDSCVQADNPARFPAVTAGEHIQEMLNASHKDRYKESKPIQTEK
ncbi:MAG: 2OG-Fe(II) oxygenase family protein [Pseudomonadota bacterium]